MLKYIIVKKTTQRRVFMKKISIFIVFALMLSLAFIFTSCDQETVDSARSELMDTCVDLLGPFLKEATETTVSSTTDSGATDSSTPTGESDNTETSVVIDVSSMF